MLKITDRDRAFACIVVPLGLLAWFVYSLHMPLAARLADARGRMAELGAPERLSAERAALEAAREASLQKLAAAEADDQEARRKESAAEGLGEADERDPSVRLGRVVAMLGAFDGLRIVSTARVAENAAGAQGALDEEYEEVPDAGSAGAGRAAGIVAAANGGAPPVLWRFEINANFDTFVRALEAISQSQLPLVIQSLSFRNLEGQGGFVRRWRLDIQL